MNTSIVNPAEESRPIDVWDPKVEIEKSHYFWDGSPRIWERARDLDARKLSVVELFSGCGGTSLGFEMAGFEVAAGLDIHAPSMETFRSHHSKAVSILADARKISPSQFASAIEISRPDVLIAGVPCQGFSLSNRKRRHDDDRNFLFLEFLKFVRQLKPRVVLLENVSGLRSTLAGKFVRDICAGIEQAGSYNVDWKLLNAADYGVPQNRQRIFFVGTSHELGRFKWPEPTHGSGTDTVHVKVGDAILDLPSLSAGTSATAYSQDARTEYQKLMRAGARELTNHVAPKHPPGTIEKIARTEPGQPIYPRFRQRIRLHPDQLSPTQVAGGIRPQFQFGHPLDARGLTVRERCRLQSFPDTFEVLGGVVQGRVQTGNAVPPLMARAVARSLEKLLD